MRVSLSSAFITAILATSVAAWKPMGPKSIVYSKNNIHRRDVQFKGCSAKQEEHITNVMSDVKKILDAAVTVKITDPSFRTFMDPESRNKELHSRVVKRFQTAQTILTTDELSIRVSCKYDEESCDGTEAYTKKPFEVVYLCPSFFDIPNFSLNEPYFLECNRLDEKSEMQFGQWLKSTTFLHEMMHLDVVGMGSHIDDCVYGPYWASRAAKEGGNVQSVEFNADNYVGTAMGKYYNTKCKTDTSYGSKIDGGDKKALGLLPMVEMPKRLGVPLVCMWEGSRLHRVKWEVGMGGLLPWSPTESAKEWISWGKKKWGGQ